MMQLIKTLMLPLAMLAGFLFYDFFNSLNGLTPYLIFTMLFITFCRISPGELRFSPMHGWLILFQVVVGILLYLPLRLWNEAAAQGIMICMVAPTAASAVVVAGMLGANVATMATFSLLSNVAAALVAPLAFSFIGTHAEMPFIESFLRILSRVVPLLVVPFAASILLQKVAPRIFEIVRRWQILSFYLWSFALMIVTGRTVSFIRAQENPDYRLEMGIALIALVVCILQFTIGRRIGHQWGDPVAGGQSIGQKNTILAIWMAQTYLYPLASIAPASYVLWQNIVNSWQLWRKRNE